ncbi:MAG: hypothetical protein AAF404_12060 [Pseudomonadota bacterium]
MAGSTYHRLLRWGRLTTARSVLLAAMLLCLIGAVHAVTPAGTVIKNQASASYRDAAGVVRYTTSNIVETLIQQVAAVQLTQDQSRPVVAGRQIFLSHTVTNAGNGSDRFTLLLQNVVTDDFDLTGLAIYQDHNQDGQPDVFAPVTVTPELAMQESWSFVIAAQIPSGMAPGDVAALEVEATSEFSSAVVALNTDTVTVADGAVVEVFKSMAATTGNSPDGPFSVTLNYRNIGTGNATDVTLIDALPDGMDYVAGSARWSGTGGLVLSDGSGGQVGTDPFLTYCAYDASCTGLAEANADVDNLSTNQVSAIISTVAPGESGSITFDVSIASGLDASALFNVAEFEYTSNATVSSRQNSNVVAFEVLHQPAVVLNGSATVATDGVDEPQVIASVAQGTAVNFTGYVWNSGNDTDTFDLVFDRVASTFPTGSIFRLLQSDGITPLLDTNGDGVPDTGPVAAGAGYAVIMQVIPPAAATGNNAGNGYAITLEATSSADNAVTNPMQYQLSDISTASVDITNIAALPDTNATGAGAGPEATPVTTFSLAPGGTAAIDLFINNTGLGAITLDLSASTESDFSALTLPTGWTVEFQLTGEDTAVTSTGVINPGEYTEVVAVISVPEDALEGDVSLYFRALSELTGATDIKHDRIRVTAVQQLLLELDQQGQTSAGGSYVYNHTLRNSGNVTISGIDLGTADNISGWSSIVYDDTNSNGSLDSSDLVITSISELTPDEARSIFVKVFAPGGAATMTSNQTTLTVSWNGGVNTAANIDTTTVADIEISIIKEQAPDYGCTGALDGAYGVGGFSVEPGNNCVSYRLTATNAGLATAFNVEIADATPAFTEYFGAAICSHTSCTIAQPAVGGQGNVVASIPSLDAGDIVTLNFSVRVE